MDAGQLFNVDPLESRAARGHGVVTSMAAGNDVILLGTSKGWIIRHDFNLGDAQRVAETFYMHAKWAKPKSLPRLKGLLVNAVAWNRQLITEASTKEVILGTQNGQLFEMAVDEAEKREKYVKQLFELTDPREPITGLQMETASVGNSTRFYVMAVTATRLYSFTGIGSLETVFARYAERRIHFMELPGEIPNSELHYYIVQRRAKHFGWLSGAGIYYGDLNFGVQHSSTGGDENFVENKGLLDYSKLSEPGEVSKPKSLAVSEFHFILLIGDKVKVVNRISQQVVQELSFDRESSKGIIGICSDPTAGVFFVYDDYSVFQVSTHDEGRDMWRVYLDKGDHAVALSNCRSPYQRDQVYLVQADAAFAMKDYYRAASFYAKMNYVMSFEEISLKFITVGEQDALRTFLLRKLDNLTREDKSQITMISTWVTELYLDKINRILLEDGTNAGKEHDSSEYESIVQEIRAFLSDNKDVLDEATTMKLLESYGREDELVYFASLKDKYEIVIHHYIQQGESKKALEVLQRPNVPVELQYKFAPDLIMLDAYETVESWMMARSMLNPRKLIPAMMRYTNEPHAKNETHEVIKYLEFCIKDLHNEDPGVHNLLLSLYAMKVDLDLAKAEADKVEEDEELRKKLWLMIAKHVIQQEKGTKRENIKKVVDFLSEANNNLLSIEDILPFFPDFDEICKSLKGYKNQIEQLKDEMHDATRGADNIRNDINALSQRYIVIDRNEECGVCKRKILGTRGAQQIASSYMSGGNIAPLYIRAQLDEAVASECPFCGDLMIREISLPFILPHESEEMASWAIKSQIPLLPKILPMTI
ncbi:vacuolar protein sorting-associated protein 18 [Carex littledalei]|uniref:Vacuolar protein sorting-associated protein 18 n=1 Tax=Carex littledalei TaxID=544730 RepID=A0A833VHK6_9POAL|nr:vacuolar protein sorting-associated protein 18 [Carex littledalei]